MPVCDPIADMLARLKNAHQALHADVRIPASKLKADLARILKEEGYVADYEVTDDEHIVVTLKYAKGKSGIAGIKRVSKPGRRVYVSVDEIPRVRNGLGICVVSTSKGVLEGMAAKGANVGGELLFEIW